MNGRQNRTGPERPSASLLDRLKLPKPPKQRISFVLKDDIEISGFIVEETDDQIVLQQDVLSPALTTIAKASIKSRQSTVSGTEFRDSVFRDIEWLFNTHSPLAQESPETLKRYPNVAASVLNFGLRGIFGKVIYDISDIQRDVSQALSRFEPRLEVERQALRVSQEGQLVEIEIQGTLLTRRASRKLWVRTDLETLVSKLKVDANG